MLSVDTALSGDAKLDSWEVELLARLYEYDPRPIDVVDRVEDAVTGDLSYCMKGVLDLRRVIVKAMRCSCAELRYYFGGACKAAGGNMSAAQVLMGVRTLTDADVVRVFGPDGEFTAMRMLAHEHANEYLEAFQLLCERAGPRWYDSIDSEGQTFLHYAAKNLEHGVFLVHHLVDCDLEACDNKGLTPLVTAIRCGNLETVKALHELGADLTFVPPPCPRSCCSKIIRPKSPLEEAIMMAGGVEIVEYLLSTGEVGNVEQKHLDLARGSGTRMLDVVTAAFEKQKAEIGPLRPGTQELIEQCRRYQQNEAERKARTASSSSSLSTQEKAYMDDDKHASSSSSKKKGTKRSSVFTRSAEKKEKNGKRARKQK
jgi:hypothetical protein